MDGSKQSDAKLVIMLCVECADRLRETESCVNNHRE